MGMNQFVPIPKNGSTDAAALFPCLLWFTHQVQPGSFQTLLN